MKSGVFLITAEEVQMIADYVMAVPTGVVPGARLVQVLQKLDNLKHVPPTITELLGQSPTEDPKLD